MENHDYPGEGGPRWRLDDHHLVPLVLVLCGAPNGGTFMHTTDKLCQTQAISPSSYSLDLREAIIYVLAELVR